jgi:Holliday junction resolvase-like predicted endonuclease
MKTTDVLILGMIIGSLLVYHLMKTIHSYKLKRQSKTSRRAERVAQHLLEQQGYKIISVQQRIPVITKVDEREYQNHVKADFIVQRDGLKYVVDVKTGAQVKKPTNADIRRQLLEYYLIYRTDGVLLVDMENKKIHTIEFDIKQPNYCYNSIKYLLAMVVGAVFALLLVWGGLFT